MEMRRGGYMSSQRWHRGGEEHAWRGPGHGRSSSLGFGGHRERGAGGGGPSGKPPYFLPFNRSFWRPVNAHSEHQQRAESRPDTDAVQHVVQYLPATTRTSLHQPPDLDELKLKDQELPEEFEPTQPSTPAQLDLIQQPVRHQLQQHRPLEQQQTTKDSQSNSDNPHILLSHAKPSEESRSPIQHQQAAAPSSIQMARIPQQLDAPSVQQNQLPQQVVLHHGQELEEMKLNKGMSSSRQMALPNSTPQSEPADSYPQRPSVRGGYHAYRRQRTHSMLHKSNKKYIVAKLEQAKRRQLNAILNKLTPQNFDKLLWKVRENNIDNVETLSWLVSQIFHRALMEPTFCQIYSQLCFHLHSSLPRFNVDNERISFLKLLLKKCQEEFERGERKEVEAGKTVQEAEICQTQEDREEMIIQSRRRNFGNIRFIGELYKVRLFPERILIHHCIKKLLGNLEDPDEVKLEALYILITATGEMIDRDHPVIKEAMDSYFDMMQKLSTNQNLCWRVRFLLRDLIDLRKNKWKQRCEMTSVSAEVVTKVCIAGALALPSLFM